VRPSQIKRFVAANADGTDTITVVIARVSKADIAEFIKTLKELDGVSDAKAARGLSSLDMSR
jgi:hypothetical protein